MRKIIFVLLGMVVLGMAAVAWLQSTAFFSREADTRVAVSKPASPEPKPSEERTPPRTTPPPAAAFEEGFDREFTVEESGSPAKTANRDWWVSSGGVFISQNGVGGTLQGALGPLSYWRLAYRLSNSQDTDNGHHPQNIFRATTKTRWLNYQQEFYFRVDALNTSESENRNQSNGVLLMGRYLDQNNLYYAGLRVDGFAVIKKKLHGEYYTLAYEPVFPGTYNRATAPLLLPRDTWLGIRTVVQNIGDGGVRVQLFIDKDRSGRWEVVADIVDDGIKWEEPISKEGYAGIRTDFMDVSFDDYRLEELPL